jgi:hypothetical protein
VEAVAVFAVLACLVALLVWASRRWGPPRFYTRGRLAWWLAAAILGVIVLWLALD